MLKKPKFSKRSNNEDIYQIIRLLVYNGKINVNTIYISIKYYEYYWYFYYFNLCFHLMNNHFVSTY